MSIITILIFSCLTLIILNFPLIVIKSNFNLAQNAKQNKNKKVSVQQAKYLEKP